MPMLDNRGQMITVEAFLAILLLFSALAVATLVSPVPTPDNHNDLANLGLQILISIDNAGQLGRLIDAKSWATLADILSIALPRGISYNLTIYDQNMNPINDTIISNGLISDHDIISVQYPCASTNPQGNNYLLRLQLAIAR